MPIPDPGKQPMSADQGWSRFRHAYGKGRMDGLRQVAQAVQGLRTLRRVR